MQKRGSVAPFTILPRRAPTTRLQTSSTKKVGFVPVDREQIPASQGQAPPPPSPIKSIKANLPFLPPPSPLKPEQEDLIRTLAEQNEAHNKQYQYLLLALPIASSIPYLLALPRPPTLLVACLGLTSLASTAFLLLSLTPTETGMALLDAWARSGPAAATAAGPSSGLGALDERRRQRRGAGSSGPARRKSPLERYLPYLNVGLCAVLVLYGLLVRRGGGGGGGGGGEARQQFGLLGLGNLPAIVYGVVVVAKLVMASVDPERELAALKYDYKGA